MIDPRITPARRARLAALAEVMLPGSAQMPSAGAVDLAGGLLDRVLGHRPDLVEGLIRAVDALGDGAFSLDRLAAFLVDDPDAYAALTTAVAGAYYLAGEVKASIGYPGQVPRTYDPYAYVEWVEEGLLDPVVARGPIYRDPPRREEAR